MPLPDLNSNITYYQRLAPYTFDVAGAGDQLVERIPIPAGTLSVGSSLWINAAINRSGGNIPPAGIQNFRVTVRPKGGAVVITGAIFLLSMDAAPNTDLWKAGYRSTLFPDAQNWRMFGGVNAAVFGDSGGAVSGTAAGVGIASLFDTDWELQLVMTHTDAVGNWRAFNLRACEIIIHQSPLIVTR